MNRIAFQALILALLLTAWPLAIWPHSADRGFVLLLPTTYYVVGGTLAVLASVLLFSILGLGALPRYQRQWMGSVWPITGFPWLSLISSITLAFLLLAGFLGDTDPLANPLPLVIWTFFWVALPLLHAAVGNLWKLINPWSGVLSLLRFFWPQLGKVALMPLPLAVGYWPAITLFVLFAWFELVSLQPEDPPTLALVVGGYWLFTLLAIIVFTEKVWLQRGEAFSVFFSFIALLSPIGLSTSEGQHKASVRFRLPTSELLRRPPLSLTAALFVLVTLATVSFDGLNKTFWWLSHHGINPLAFDGRSSVTQINTTGLGMACIVLVVAYVLAVISGWWLQRRCVTATSNRDAPWQSVGLFALAVLPISLGYHAAHYLTQLLVNGQYLLKSLADPLDRGWDLLGTADLAITTSFLSHHHSVERLWQLQLACIVLGHIVSALIAHMLALRLYQSHKAAVISQLPLALLMVLYTCFGLWLLSTPTGL